MNNEEKILAVLEQLQQGQARTDARLDTMLGDIAELKTDVSDIRSRVTKTEIVQDEIAQRVTGLEVIQENVTNKHIGLLMDGNIDIMRKLSALDELPERVEDIQMTVSILKQAVKK